jgi:hypothetical protein
MQTLEAMLSLVFFIWAAALAVSSYEVQSHDDSLYRLHLAGDSWRVLYLQGKLQNITDIKLLEPSLDEMNQKTGLCFFIDGISATSCRGGTESHEITVSLSRTLLVKGIPRQITLSVGK